MKKNLFFFIGIFLLLCQSNGASAQYIINTIAGTGTAGSSGDGGAATAARVNNPITATIDAGGNIYVCDSSNSIRKIDASGIISTIAGTGTAGFSGDGAPATAAELNYAHGITRDTAGNLYFVDRYNMRIRKITTSGDILTIAGNGGSYSGDGGPATAAGISDPSSIAADTFGNIYIADEGSQRVRKIDASGTISTIAGTGSAGYSGDGGAATGAELNAPAGIAIDAAGNIYIADAGNHCVRMINTTGNISTFAGNGTSGYTGDGGAATIAELIKPQGVAIDATGNVYITDANAATIRKVNTSGIITTIAGTGTAGFSGDGGAATANTISYPMGISVDGAGTIYFADLNNHRVRSLTSCTSPVVGAITGATSVCTGANITLADTTSGGTWSSSHPSVASVSASGVVSGISTGTDTIYYSVSNACGVTRVAHIINVITLPAAGTISGTSSVCTGATITLTESVSGGSWSISNTNASISASGIVTGITAGLDTVNYFVVNSCGVSVASKVITINPLPNAGTISGASAVCVGANITLTDGATGGSWTTTTGNATVAGGVVTGVTMGTDTVVYTVTNSCGTATATHAVTINPLPVAGAITGATVVCEGATTTLTDSASGGSWSAVNTNATVSSAGVVTGVMAGTDTIMYTVTNSCGTATASHIITINPLPNPGTISGTSTLCLGDSAVLTETVSGGVWTATNATASISDSLIAGVSTGVDTIQYSVTNSCGTTTASHIVTISTTPVAGPITGLHSICAGTSFTLGAPTAGTWSVTNGNASLVADTLTGVLAGTDTVIRISTNACGTDTASFVVIIDTAAPHASVITGPYIVCVADTIRVADSVAGGVWSSNNTALATINSAGLIRGVAAGLDTVNYIITNGCGADTVHYEVTINPLPVAGTITGYDSVCAGSSILLNTTGTGGTWISGSPDFGTVDTSGRVFGVLFGSTIITYSVSNSCGTAEATHRVNINVPAQPIIGSDIICLSSLTSPVPSIYFDAVPNGTWSSSNFAVALVIPFSGGTVIGLSLGTATLTYTVNNACGTTRATMDVEVIDCSKLDAGSVAKTTEKVSLSPNPNNGNFTINIPSATAETIPVVITDLLGKKVKEFSVTGNKPTTINVDLPAGVYFLTGRTENGHFEEKVIIAE